MENGEYPLAIPVLQSYISQYPEDTAVQELMGDCCIKTGSVAEAIAAYTKVIKSDPGLTRVYYKLGNAYDISEKTDSSVYFFENFIKKRTSFS